MRYIILIDTRPTSTSGSLADVADLSAFNRTVLLSFVFMVGVPTHLAFMSLTTAYNGKSYTFGRFYISRNA